MPQDKGFTKSVRLKNGDEVPEMMVRVLMLSLRTLLEDNAIALYELVMACRERDHVLWGNAHEVLISMNLIDGIDEHGHARIHDITRSIVVSAAEGEEMQMHLVNPIAG